MKKKLKNLRINLDSIKTEVVEPLSQQLRTYEKKALGFLKDFDLKSREARDKGKKRLEEFARRLNQTRGKLEKRVKKMVEDESRVLNKHVNQFVDSLKHVATSDERIKKTVAKVKKTVSATRKKTQKASSRVKKVVVEARESSTVPKGFETPASQGEQPNDGQPQS